MQVYNFCLIRSIRCVIVQLILRMYVSTICISNELLLALALMLLRKSHLIVKKHFYPDAIHI